MPNDQVFFDPDYARAVYQVYTTDGATVEEIESIYAMLGGYLFMPKEALSKEQLEHRVMRYRKEWLLRGLRVYNLDRS